MNARGAVLLSFAMAAACASDEPATISGFDSSAGLVEVFVGDDGFVTSAGERLPYDEFVLRMRQRTRAMSADELQRFVVQIRLAPGLADDEAKAAAWVRMNRLLDELVLMGVRWAKLL
jgi:hypothetical protein